MLHIRLLDELKFNLKAEAVKQRISMTKLVQQIIFEYLENKRVRKLTQ